MSHRKGHVVILVENLPVPFDRRVWMEALTLTAAGYAVSVISPCPEGDRDRPHRVIDGIRVRRYPMPTPTQSKLSFFREFTYCLWQTRKLLRDLWREDPFDVIHACNPPDTFWFLARAYRRRGVRFVYDQHDLCPELYESRFGKRGLLWRGLLAMERQQFRQADRVIAPNETHREVATNRGRVDPDRVTVVRSGPSLERFTPVPPVPELKHGRRHLVVYLGVMGPQDGVDLAVRAAHALYQRGRHDTHFVFIGRGDAFDDLVALSDDLGVSGQVTFTGRIPDDELRRFLCTADLAVVPDPKNTYSDACTLNKVIEYMSMGVPIVAFDGVETRRSALDAARYVADNDPASMAEAIDELLEDESARERMSAFGRQRFADRLAWEHSAPELIGVYDGLLSPKRNAQLDVPDRVPSANTVGVA